MASVSCRRLENNELTVGAVFSVVCEGEWPELNPDQLELLVDKENQYKLKLKSFQFKSANEAELQFTTFEVGEHSIKAVQLADPEHSVVLGDLQLKVISVQKPEEPVTEPLGPTGPFSLQIGLVYWIIFFAVLSSVLGLLGVRIYRRREKIRLLQKMNLDQYVSSPLQQFYSSVRKLQRSSSFIFEANESDRQQQVLFISELEKIFRLFLARTFVVPALDWSPRRMANEIRNKYSWTLSQIRKDYKKLFSEFERAQKIKKQNSLKNQDCVQLFEMTQKLVEMIDRLKSQEDKE